jgi:hypothetical protein
MAVPFYATDRNRVEAVLYLEVNRREFLTPGNDGVSYVTASAGSIEFLPEGIVQRGS